MTPSYNQGRFIETTVRSVLSQDDRAVEYIVVDGASTDQTPQVLRRYADRIDRLIREPDRGQSDAINKGFRAASGDIIAWINSDDYYFPNAVAAAASAFERDPDLDVFYGDCVYTDENGWFLRYFTEIRPFSKHVLLNYSNFIMQPATFFRRTAAERLGFLREHLHYTMDWDLWCRFAEAGCHFRYEPTLIAANRQYPQTKTLAGGSERRGEILRHNREHGTTRLPWAAASFRVGEAIKQSRWGGRQGWLYPWVRRGKRWLRHEPQNHLYGLEAHGSALDHDFRLCFPWYEDGCQQVAVEVGYQGRRPADLMLTLADQTAKARLADGQTAQLAVALAGRRRLTVDLRGRWSSDGPGQLRLRRVEVH